MFCPPQAWKIKPLHPMWVHEIFSFCGAPTYRSRLCKTKWWPPMPAAGDFFWIWGALYTKNTSPPGGQRPPQAEKFGHLGGVVHKNHVAGMHSGTCFWRKTPPKILKISASGGPNPQILEKTPPLIVPDFAIRGGFFSRNSADSVMFWFSYI